MILVTLAIGTTGCWLVLHLADSPLTVTAASRACGQEKLAPLALSMLTRSAVSDRAGSGRGGCRPSRPAPPATATKAATSPSHGVRKSRLLSRLREGSPREVGRLPTLLARQVQ